MKDHNDKKSLTLGEFREMTKHLDDSTPMAIVVFGEEYNMYPSEWEEENEELYYELEEW